MFNSIYIFKVEDKKNIKKLIKYHIYFENIVYDNKSCYIYVDYYNYCKVLKYKKLFNIELVDTKGVNKYKYLLKKYFLFFISIIVGIVGVYFLSNVIFDVKIMTNKEELYKLLSNELDYYGISKYNLVKSFEEKELIKKKILEEHKDKIEWLEFDRKGSVYYINVLERIINEEDDSSDYRHLVSKKNAIILEIKAEDGEIVKKINDYVNKGDIIVSGTIMKGEEVRNYVKAKGNVYGETWYNVSVELPINYYEKVYTGNEKKRLTINYFDKHIKLFNFSNYQNEERSDKVIFQSKILPFSITYSTFKEINLFDDVYTLEKAMDKGMNLARTRLLETLDSDSKILSQKKLKLYTKDSKIFIEVFFKVYENITDYCDIVLEGE